MSLKEQIFSLRKKGKTYNEISKKLRCSKAVISYHCKKNELNDIGLSNTKIADDITSQIDKLKQLVLANKEIADILGVSVSTIKRYSKVKITKKRIKRVSNSQVVKSWRKRRKRKAVKYKGGCCIVCGYAKSLKALTFHHKNPDEKDFGFSSSNYAWDKTQKELDKCVLVCSNCHSEIHDNLIDINDYILN